MRRRCACRCKRSPTRRRSPEIPDMPREVAVLHSDVLRIRVRARDDFGVRDFGLTWELTEDSPRMGVATTEIKTQPPSPRVKAVGENVSVESVAFRHPGRRDGGVARLRAGLLSRAGTVADGGPTAYTS